jgi:hypothetical protein
MRLRTPWLWGPLLLAFAPTLAALVSDLRLGPRHAFVIAVAAGLVLLCVRERGAAAAPGRSSGLMLLALGLLLELFGAASETQFVARCGLPLAALGLARWLGAPRLQVVALSFWCVPLPNALIQLTSPALESLWASLAAALVGATGAEVRAAGISLFAGDARLDLRSENGGLLVAHALAAFGWFLSTWRGQPLVAALRRALSGYALGFALQPLSVTLALVALLIDQRELARAWLTHLQWALAAFVWWHAEHHRLRAPRPSRATSRAAPRPPMTPA